MAFDAPCVKNRKYLISNAVLYCMDVCVARAAQTSRCRSLRRRRRGPSILAPATPAPSRSAVPRSEAKRGETSPAPSCRVVPVLVHPNFQLPQQTSIAIALQEFRKSVYQAFLNLFETKLADAQMLAVLRFRLTATNRRLQIRLQICLQVSRQCSSRTKDGHNRYEPSV